MKFKIVLVALAFYFAEADKAGFSKNGSPGFLLTLPPFFTYGKDENTCISLHDVALPTNANITLKTNGEEYLTNYNFSDEYSCFQLKVPKGNLTQSVPVTVQVQLQAGQTVLSGNNSEPLMISAPKQSAVFLQTDRQTYKPGDLLRIRILQLNYDFLAGNEQKISLVTLKNPIGITIAVWNDVKTNQGLAHLMYQLSDETVEGNYLIETQGAQKRIEIKKYVLPRFKVSLKHPDNIFIDAKSLEVEVCARYPYGHPVQGLAKIRIYKEYYYSPKENFTNITETKKLTLGCASFTLSAEELKITEFTWMPLSIKGIVTEAGTDLAEEAQGECRTSYQSFQIEVEREQKLFIPGLPYNGVIKFSNVQDIPKNKKVRVCYSAKTNDEWQFSFSTCSHFNIDYENIPFTIPPLHEDIGSLKIQVTVPKLTRHVNNYNQNVQKMNSERGNYFYLKQAKGNAESCNASQEFSIYYTINDGDENSNLTFYYLVKSNNKVVKLEKVNRLPENVQTVKEGSLQNIIGQQHNYTQYNTKFGYFNISFQLNRNILWKYKLLVYRVLPNGKIIAEKVDVELKPCLPNKVEADWSQEQVRPGSEVVLNIRTSPSSLCSVTAVDEATKYRSSDNFNALKILQTLINNYQYPASYGLPSCEDNEARFKRSARQRRSADFKFAHEMFKEFGTSVVTNFEVPARRCDANQFAYTDFGGYRPVYLELASGGIAPFDDRIVEGAIEQYASAAVGFPGSSGFVPVEFTPVRNFFPETWLWELLPVSDDGRAMLEKNIPHTITNWVSDVLCVSPTEGVGLSNASNLVTFQPFFVDVITPYSIKRGEILHLKIKVFNYVNQSIPVRINLVPESYLDLVAGNSESGTVCIESGSNVDFVRKIKAKEIGRLNITVVAEVVEKESESCGSQGTILHKDIVQKMLLVEAEGLPVEVTNSALLCANATHPQNVTWVLQLPKDSSLVPGSAKSKVIVNSDIFGSTVENLDSLLTVPTGCGEQVMSKLAPNLYILRYLNATDQLTDAVRNKAIEYIKIGYQKILTYLHGDGSFSAFGERDGLGSMFLTTFVLKTLTLAQSYIYIDNNMLNRSRNWIFEHQLENGCFPPLHHSFQRLADLNETATPTLTSYVLVSLKKAGVEIPKSVIEKATSCIIQNDAADDYALALTSYALLLVDSPEAMNRLKQLVENLHKENSEDSPRQIETLAYALLSLLQRNDEKSLSETTNLVHQLASKMSPRGGFRSTQDTVVALDALSKYAVKVGTKPNVKVQFKAAGQEEELLISGKEHLKLTTFDLKQIEDTVSLSVSGEGCVLAQAVVTYNVYNFAEKPAFNVTVGVVPSNKSCSNPVLNTCLSYIGEEKRSNMAVMEIGVPSGFRADENEMQGLLAQGVKRFEQDKNKVALYFTDLTSEQLCMSLTLNEVQKIENRTAAAVNVFDYYKPENKASSMYSYEGCK